MNKNLKVKITFLALILSTLTACSKVEENHIVNTEINLPSYIVKNNTIEGDLFLKEFSLDGLNSGVYLSVESQIVDDYCTIPLIINVDKRLKKSNAHYPITVAASNQNNCRHKITFLFSDAENHLMHKSVHEIAVTDSILIVSDFGRSLPANAEVDTIYPFRFVFENINPNISATGVAISHEELKGWVQKKNTCNGTVPPFKSCHIYGEYAPDSQGNKSLNYMLSYNEGESIPVSSTTNVTDVDVRGTITTKLPENTTLNAPYNTVFTFKNSNKRLQATNVAIKDKTANLTINTDNCSPVIAADSECTINGTFTPTFQGEHKISITLSYDQGNDVVLPSKTQTNDVAVQASVPMPIPEEVDEDGEYEIVFSLENTGTVEALILDIEVFSDAFLALGLSPFPAFIPPGVTFNLPFTVFLEDGTVSLLDIDLILTYEEGAPVLATTEANRVVARRASNIKK